MQNKNKNHVTITEYISLIYMNESWHNGMGYINISNSEAFANYSIMTHTSIFTFSSCIISGEL